MTDCFREGFAAGVVCTAVVYVVVDQAGRAIVRAYHRRQQAERERAARDVARWRRENVREPEE